MEEYPIDNPKRIVGGFTRIDNNTITITKSNPKITYKIYTPDNTETNVAAVGNTIIASYPLGFKFYTNVRGTQTETNDWKYTIDGTDIVFYDVYYLSIKVSKNGKVKGTITPKTLYSKDGTVSSVITIDQEPESDEDYNVIQNSEIVLEGIPTSSFYTLKTELPTSITKETDLTVKFGLSKGTIIGISVGGAVLAIIILIIIVLIIRRLRR